MTPARCCRAISGRPGEGLTFPQEYPEFEKYTKYNIFHKEENDISAYWLESCDPQVTFTLVDPTVYGLNYDSTR